ncbi:hypothetical protein AOLI_G00228140 [Acnodon oligacanthus]
MGMKTSLFLLPLGLIKIFQQKCEGPAFRQRIGRRRVFTRGSPIGRRLAVGQSEHTPMANRRAGEAGRDQEQCRKCGRVCC